MVLLVVKFVHTLVFLLLSSCVLYILFCGITNRFPRNAFLAILLILIEGVILLLNGGQCPLTTLAEHLGAADGQVADIFLPRWFADRLFALCTPLFVASSILLLIRRLLNRKLRRESA